MAAVLAALSLSLLVRLASGLGDTDTITWGGDNTRAGYQTNHNMDPSIVGSDDFYQIFQTKLPGDYGGQVEKIFSQPLVYTPSDETTQYVYFATTQNNVYKMDSQTGEILVSRNLAIPFLVSDLDGCVDINPHVGVTATGVIDPDTDTLYLTAKTYEDQSQYNVAQGRPAGRYYFYALDVHDLTDKENFPVSLEGIVANNNEERNFNGGIHLQRPALLHYGNYIYAGFASHCVQYNFTGWIMGWDKTTGELVEHWATEGEGVPNQTPGGGIWMSGGGLASDGAGSMYFSTGNGYASQLSTVPVEGRDPPTSLEEAAVHMSINDDGSLTIVDFFMPQEKQALDGADKDLGTSPLELLPSEFSCGDITSMGVITGKSGKTYFLNLEDLGGYRTGTDNGDRVIQVFTNENSVYSGAGVYPLEGGYIYISVIGYPTHVFKFSCTDGTPSFTKVADSPDNNAAILGVSHGTVTSMNGEEGTGLLWIVDVQNQNLRIYDAVPDGDYLTLINSFKVTGTTKFTRAVFGDGRVYLGTTLGYVYGFGGPTTNPMNCTTPKFDSLDLEEAAETAEVTCTAAVGLTLTNITLNSTEFAISDLPTLPTTLEAGDVFTFMVAFDPTEVGDLSDTVQISTDNSVTGYTSKTAVILSGTATSQDPVLSLSPSSITISDYMVGSDPDGLTQTAILYNEGNSTLTLTGIQYSLTSASGPYVEPSGNGSTVGIFTVTDVPSTIAAGGSSTVSINFNPTDGGSYSLYILFASDGGNETLTVTANAGSAPVWLMEFQTPDGTGWVTYSASKNFTFGNVTENTSSTLKFRVTNNGSADAVPLSLTVSKMPYGTSSIINAANQADLAEGTELAAGESATATMYCTVPKEQWNVDTYWGTSNWTMNTNDPDMTKQYIRFSCAAVSEQAAPLDASGQGIYRYIGCYKENNPGRQLTTQLYGNVNNTNAMCIAACAEGGYTYCGTQYERECWAGNTIPTEEVDEDDCNYSCSGDIEQICGGQGTGNDAGGSFISLFSVNGTVDNMTSNTGGGDGSSASAVVNPGTYGYVSIGCYHEPDDTRALAYVTATTSETVEACLLTAYKAGYTYAGLEYGGECWLDYSLSSSAYSTSLSSCSMTCNDNSSEYCGGSSVLNLYQYTPLWGNTTTNQTKTTTTSVLPSSTPTVSPITNPGENGYSFIGCYMEPTSIRALTYQLSVANETVASCLDLAAAAGYLYAGLEYGGECWCGNKLNNATLSDTSKCSMPCNDNATEYCGASLYLDLYKRNATATTTTLTSTTTTATTVAATTTGPVINSGANGYTYAGCYHEPADTSRALSYQLTVTNETVDACLKLAAASGYKYAGLEYGGECWSGNALSANATLESDSACTMTCNDNSTEYCGGSSLLDLYELESVLEATSTAKQTSTVVSLAATNQTTATTTSSAARNATASTTSRAAVISLIGSNQTTTEATTSRTTSASKTSTTVAATISPVINPGTQGYHFLGCYHEPSDSRALTNQLTVTTRTVDACLKLAAEYGYTYAGLEYGGECWCGNTLNIDATLEDSDDCTMTCSNNSTEYCGGSSLLEVYRQNSTTTTTSTTSKTSQTTTTSAAATSTSPVINPGSNGYSFIGCYHEPADTSRALVYQLTVANETVGACLAKAAAGNYKYAGLEYGGECWSGNTLSASATLEEESDCTMTCNDNSTEYCGGSSLLELYKFNATITNSSSSANSTYSYIAQLKARSAIPSAATVSESATANGTWNYLGCYTEGASGRALTASAKMSLDMTHEACATFCAAYTFFGVQYGNRCSCGNFLADGSAAKDESLCSTTCSGDASEVCGAPNLLTLYQQAGRTATQPASKFMVGE